MIKQSQRVITRMAALSALIAVTAHGRSFHDQVHMDIGETSNVDLVVSHHKGFGPDEIDVQRAVDKARMAGHDQKAEYKAFLKEEIREHEVMKEKMQRHQYSESSESRMATANIFTRHNGQGNVRHFNNNNNNEDEMEAFFMQIAVTLIFLLLVGVAGIVVYNSCIRVKKAVNESRSPGSIRDTQPDSATHESFPARKGNRDMELGLK